MILTIIGAGPGGYETAAAAAANGIETYLISEGPLGGTCLNEAASLPRHCAVTLN